MGMKNFRIEKYNWKQPNKYNISISGGILKNWNNNNKIFCTSKR